jgi:site-specific DNA-cytosine methylase
VTDAPTHLDLFTGLGGFAIAAQAAGFETLAMCEKEPRCQRFLRKTWGLPVHPDITKLDGRRYRGISLLTGGPPCQPASRAGKQLGAQDDRWLWGEAIRVLAESWADSFVFENPLGLLDLAEYRVSPPLASDGSPTGNLGDLFTRSGRAIIDAILAKIRALHYEVQPLIIPACSLDSPQLRERLWIVGFMADTHERRRSPDEALCPRRNAAEYAREFMAVAAGPGREGADTKRRSTRRGSKLGARDVGGANGDRPDSEHARDRRGQEGPGRESRQESDRPDSDGDVADTAGPSGTEQGRKSRRASRRETAADHAPESGRTHQGLADPAEQHGRGREHAAPFGRWGDTLLADSERERRQRGSIGSDDAEEERSWSETLDAITRLHWEPYQWTSCSDGKFRRTPVEPFDVVNGLHRSVLTALGNAILPQAAFPILHAMRPHIR